MSALNASATRENSGSRNLFYVPTFHFNLAKPCYCGSNILFGQCCGSSEQERTPPKHIHIVKNFLSDTECKRFIRFATKQKRSSLPVADGHKETGNKVEHTKSATRVTERVALGRKQALANAWFESACMHQLSRLSTVKTQWFEAPHLLRYGPGGKYDIHSDAEHFDFQAQRFYRFIDRDFSMLIYLNDDYEGGGLNFPWLNYQYQPKAGDLVFFPSNHVFTHESLPIISGTKYALVSWGAFRGSPRVRQPRTMLTV